MESHQGYTSKKIPEETLEEFFFEAGIWGNEEDFPNYLKGAVVGSRMNHLRKSEWQRWVPVLSLWRTIRDTRNGNHLLLDQMHSERYNTFNEVYSSIAFLGAIYPLFEIGLKYFVS